MTTPNPSPQYNFRVNLDDLNFILRQIKIAEASTNPLTGEIQNLPALVGSPLLPYGLRTVDGTWNSLLPGMERAGAADNVMPRLVEGTFTLSEGRPPEFFYAGDPGSAPASYADPGTMYDTRPRLISNLIVDQTGSNPAAVAAAQDRADASTFPGMDEVHVAENGTLLIPNQSPDIGLSAPFNGVMTLFGQFFDHGLDLITKGAGTVFVPLRPDDPLYVEGSSTNFMVLSRAANSTGPGKDGVMGTADDDTHGHTNTTTSFVDQNQTYTSHPSHQVFLREYHLVGGKPQSTGALLDGAHGIANWGEVKAQAAQMLGIRLSDSDVFDIPLLATDRYGEYLRGPNGYVQMVTTGGLVEGNPSANGGLGVSVPANVVRTGHAFLVDIAHSAAPLPGLVADSNGSVGNVPNPDYDPSMPITTENPLYLPQPANTYDNELLDRHFITGDGRGNENIGLTTIHAVFHSEHNRLVEDYKKTILASGDLAVINEWLLVDLAELPTAAQVATLTWDGERLFQAGRFATEMQYQHLVFEEFARVVQPSIDPFVFSNSPDIDPAIMEEFANVVYRFGHSMLTEDIARMDRDLVSHDIGLIQAFLNPVEFDQDGDMSQAEAIGALVRGMSRQVGNEIDEFVTDALRNNLVGLPLDLAALNIARARETGAPSFNEARRQFFAATGDEQLRPYASWADLAPHLKNPASIINFIAAYGTHPTITGAQTLEDKRAAATLLVLGDTDLDDDGHINTDPLLGRVEVAPADRLAFLNASAATSGLDTVDFWIGGLAEAKLEFGGMLGPTFNYVFESQMENLQNGDRFYYLSRTQGLNMLNELEGNLFTTMVMRNSDLGDAGNTTHLPGHLFMTPSYTLEMNQANQRTGIIGPDGVTRNGDPTRGDVVLDSIAPLVIRVAPGDDVDNDGAADGGVLKYAYDGADHMVLGGTPGNDAIYGGRGMDTLWGDEGNDFLDGGDEADEVHGGDGDDIIVDHGTPAGAADFLRGDAGNDVISNGTGNDIVFGGPGKDMFIVGPDFTEVFAGPDDDFLLGGNGSDILMGNEGNDWVEGGEGFDTLSGENSQLFFNSTIIGHDVLIGQGNDTDYDGESGNDIMAQAPGIQRNNGMLGFDWAIHKNDPVPANSDLGIPIFSDQELFILRDRFDSVEALSGWKFDDVLVGTDFPTGAVGNPGDILNGPESASRLLQKDVALIAGLQQLLGAPHADPEAVVIDPVNGADILIGGAGSDRFTGKRGNDLIDGDAWLNVRISVRSKTNPAVEIRSVDSLNEIKGELLAGTINPGQLVIVGEILIASDGAETDVAVFSDLRINYDVTRNEDGSFTVAHVRGTQNDGTDRVRNVERLLFSDESMNLTGEPLIIESLLREGSALTAEAGTIGLFNGIDPSDVTFQWQVSSGAGFANIAGATGESFVPTQAEVGKTLRVAAIFTDMNGIVRTVYSAPTGGVGDVMAGDGLANHLVGTPFSDELSGLGGNDTLDGGLGADDMYGGAGDDLYMVDDYGDIVQEPLGGNAGTDTVRVTLDDYILPEFVEHATYTGAASFLGMGNELNNTLTGGAGDDAFDGQGGSDTLVGGAGNDFYVIGAGDTIVELAAGGIDSVYTELASYTLPAEVEDLTYTGIGQFNGTGNASPNLIAGSLEGRNVLRGLGGADHLIGGYLDDTLEGGAGADTLEGLEGNDILRGGGGIDTMIGGAGDDIYYVDNVNGVVTEIGGEGSDKVRTALPAYALGAAIEDLDYTGSTNFAGTGNELSNWIVSGAGNDTLDGGAGVDMLAGGTGNDVYIVDEALDTVSEASGSGTDQVRMALPGYTLAPNVENLLFTGTGPFAGTGNGQNNAIVGGAGDDLLNGMGGTDTMTGGAGNDTYVVERSADVVVEASGAAGGSADQVNSLAGSYTLGANVERLVFTGSGSFTGTGNGLANFITGGAGADNLNGMAGNDTMTGLAGNDTYTVDSAGDVVIEAAAAGTDTIRTSLGTYTLPNNVEQLTRTGGSGTLTGNSLANVLTGAGGIDTLNGMDGNDTLIGNAGNDIMLGGGGNDTFTGGAGNDNMTGGAGNDRYVFAPGFGADRILDFDANATGGQDLLNLSGFGITAANFSSRVTVTDIGNDVRITVSGTGGGTIVLVGITSVSQITVGDFWF